MTNRPDHDEFFHKANVLITGGLGFLGSNLALELVRLGARVTVVDAMIPDYGANLFNIAPAGDQIDVHQVDIRDAPAMNRLVRGQDFIFHLAGQVDHIMSLREQPFDDIDINMKGTAVLLEACRHHRPEARIVYTGTRGQYGKPSKLPVSEDAPTNPLGVYEITNLAAEKMIEAYHLVFGIPAILLRISNVYGPRAQMRHSRYGVANWFVRLALDGSTIPVFGDGKILRDFLYVDDCVAGILASARCPQAWGEVFNIGRDEPTCFRDLAEAVCRAADAGTWELAPFSPERKAQEPGDYYSDISKIRSVVGWEPKVTLADGLAQTVEYYRKYREYYW